MKELYTKVYGISCSEIIKFGMFTIYPGSILQKKVTKLTVPVIDTKASYVSVSLPFTDQESDFILAKKRFIDFKRIMDYCCGRNNGVPAVNILSEVSKVNSIIVPISEVNTISKDQMNIGYIPMIHDIKELKKEMDSCNQFFIWDIYSKEKKTDKENRLINAVLWIGKAHPETDNNIKLLEYCFAMESLLQEDIDKFINPSITYTLSNACAIIIAKQYEDRKMVIRNLKDIYQKRSKLAHGKKVDVVNKDCETIFMYLAYLIKDLFSDVEWKDYDNINEVLNHVEDIKLGKKDDN